MREVARSTTTPGRPSEYWTYMLSSQSRAGNCGHAGRVAKRLKIWSTRGCATVCGKLPTSEGAAKKRGCSILPLLGSGENHTASTPCTISEIRTSCSEAQYNSKTHVLRGGGAWPRSPPGPQPTPWSVCSFSEKSAILAEPSWCDSRRKPPFRRFRRPTPIPPRNTCESNGLQSDRGWEAQWRLLAWYERAIGGRTAISVRVGRGQGGRKCAQAWCHFRSGIHAISRSAPAHRRRCGAQRERGDR